MTRKPRRRYPWPTALLLLCLGAAIGCTSQKTTTQKHDAEYQQEVMSPVHQYGGYEPAITMTGKHRHREDSEVHRVYTSSPEAPAPVPAEK